MVTFAAGEGEAAALAEAIAGTDNFVAKVADGKEKVVLANISQSELTGGS